MPLGNVVVDIVVVVGNIVVVVDTPRTEMTILEVKIAGQTPLPGSTYRSRLFPC